MKRIEIPITNEKNTEENKDSILRKYRLSSDSIAHFKSKIKHPGSEDRLWLSRQLNATISAEDYNEMKDIGKVINLILDGANVDYHDNIYDDNLLNKCAYKNHLWTFIHLVKAGADINQKNRMGYTPLISATSSNSKEILEILILLGADINAKTVFGNTAADMAIMLDRHECYEMLVKAGGKAHEDTPYFVYNEEEKKLVKKKV